MGLQKVKILVSCSHKVGEKAQNTRKSAGKMPTVIGGKLKLKGDKSKKKSKYAAPHTTAFVPCESAHSAMRCAGSARGKRR